MSRDTGGPAFPVSDAHSALASTVTEAKAMARGMSLRDYFAAKALQGVLYMAAHGAHGAADSPEGCAAEAYKLADAMLAERAK